MKAIVIPRNGPPTVFEERELPDKHLRPQDVSIRVEAAGVNFADLMGRVGLYPDAPRLPYAPGYEIAGVVEEAGGRGGHAVGTRVMATTRFWGYADRVRIPGHQAVAIPDDVDFATASGIPVNYLTAHLALLHSGNARPGERVLVHGGAGGVGLAVLDISRDTGIELYATAGSDEKCARLEGMGIVRAVNYREQDYATAFREILGGRGFHLILDPLGPESFAKGLGLLEPLGRLVCYGFSNLVTGPKRRLWRAVTKVLGAQKLNPITLMNANQGVLGLNLAQLITERELHAEAMAGLGARLAAGGIRPTLDKVFPFSAKGAADAHTWLHERRNFGKVVLSREAPGSM
jgi:NADPH:quinone reductase-like Zn-dependent oxidoreductase